MKDMLASLPQYQEQREAVGLLEFYMKMTGSLMDRFLYAIVLLAYDHGSRMYGHFRTCQVGFGWQCRTG
jgi:hypothetical protein